MHRIRSHRYPDIASLDFTLVALVALVALLSVMGCSPRVRPASPSSDRAPTVTINAFDVGGAANVESGKGNMTGPGTVNVDTGAHLMLTVGASNPGGVQRLEITIRSGDNTLFQARSVATVDGDGRVPAHLQILATDGAGNQGSKPMEVMGISAPIRVTVSSTNFNAQTTTFAVTYIPLAARLRREEQRHGPPTIPVHYETIALRLNAITGLLEAPVPTVPASGVLLSAHYDNSPHSMIFYVDRDLPAGAPCDGVRVDIGGTSGLRVSVALPAFLRFCTKPGTGPIPSSLDLRVGYRYH